MSFAFIFPGQGSQSLNMINELNNFKVVKDTFIEASDIIGINLLQMLSDETTDRINQTQNTQPLMLASGVATYRVWQELGGETPSTMAGHSLGEYSALVCSGSIEFSNAVRLVYARANLMQNAVAQGSGAMSAVLGVDDDTVVKLCNETESLGLGVVEAVNFNSPGQVVIAGDKIAVEKASEILKENGARKVMLLPVSVPSHCRLMKGASEQLALLLSEVNISMPNCNVLHNYDASISANVNNIRDNLARQLYTPVLWTNTIRNIVKSGITNMVECGAGKILSGLNKRIDSSIVSYNLNNKDDFDHAITNL